MAVIIPAALAVGYGIYSTVHAANQKKKALAQMNNVKRPTLTTPQPILDNQAIANYMASQGMSQQSKDIATQNYNRGLTSSLNAILQGGGSGNDVSKVYDNYNSGIGKIALADDAIRRQNVASLLNQNQVSADYQDRNWQVNQYGPYADAQQKNLALMGLAQKADDQAQSGITTAIGGISRGASGISQRNDINNMNGMGNGSGIGLAGGYNSTYNNLIGAGNGNNVGSTYDPVSNSYMQTLDWSKVKPENRAYLYSRLNMRSGNYGNSMGSMFDPGS